MTDANSASPALRSLPSIDALLRNPDLQSIIDRCGRPVVTYVARRVIDRVRHTVAEGQPVPSHSALTDKIARDVNAIVNTSLKPVINATGIILHTNLGRAPLGAKVLQDIAPLVLGYSNLEFDLSTGQRGHRGNHCVPLLRYLTGAPDAVIVNNNAAGIILALNTFARNKEVIISRGELIEIGGAFRIPEIMAASGAVMVEVGTTNRTRLSDYEKAITENTACIFKAHTSNYRIVGFTEEVGIEELANLGHQRGVLTIYDIGSGLLRRPPGDAFLTEPDVHSAIGSGVDLVTFSCDKLMGGPQAGIVAGREDLVASLSRAPLMRALRVGKLTLAALASACTHYLSDESLRENNPALSMFTTPVEAIKQRAERLCQLLSSKGIEARVVESCGQTGGGAMPTVQLPSRAVELIAQGASARDRERFSESVFHALLQDAQPVVSILREGRVLLDCLTIFDQDLSLLSEAISRAMATSSRKPSDCHSGE